MKSKVVSILKRLKKIEQKKGLHKDPNCGVSIVDDGNWTYQEANYMSSGRKGYLVLPKTKEEEAWIKDAQAYYAEADKLQERFMNGEDIRND